MNHIKPYRLFESVEKESIGLIDKFNIDYGTDLDMKLKPYQIEIINKAFSHFNKKFIKNKIQKLSLLSILQESKKGFGEDGNFEVPDIAMPYLEKSGLNIADAINPYLEAIKEKSPQMQQQAMMNQTPPPQGPQSPMPMRGGIAKKGGLVRMKNGGAVPSYQNAGEVVGLKPGHRVDKETGQLIDETGNVVGQFKYGNGTIKNCKSSFY
jgi:hypothetical protein